MSEMTHQKTMVGALHYTDGVLGLDPIGSGDLRADYYLFVEEQVHVNSFIGYPEAWAEFNERIVKPVYKLDIPAVGETRIV